MDSYRKLLPWLIVVTGIGAVLMLTLHLHEPGVALIVAFVLAGLLSSLRPSLATLWAAVAGGLSGAQAAGAWADPQSVTVAPGILAFLLLLPVAVAIAGAGAGAAVTGGDEPRPRSR